MDNPLGNFADETQEVVKDTARDLMQETKKQILQKKDDKQDNKKTAPVTNKPIPTKKVLTQLSAATTQLQHVKIKKISEEVTYIKKNTVHTFEINGKTVRVGEFFLQDNEFEQYDNEENVNEEDIKALTDEEHEALGEYMRENLDLTVGEEWDPDQEPEEISKVK